MKAKQDKYIDLMQFPHNGKGQISWKDSVGTVAEFFYNGERHELEILERINKNHLKIRVDDIVIEKAHPDKITKLMFKNLFYKPNYDYDVGATINNLVILEQCIVKRNGVNAKAYRVKCLVDGYEFVSNEINLRNGHGCPVCSSTIVVKGINDIATTDPRLAKLFVDKNDTYKYSRKSDAEVIVECPNCHCRKTMKISQLTLLGHVSCNMCSDGVSYPNKFAHELFSQLSGQYIEYKYEYSPDWAKTYFYDNYIKLYDGREIVVEMDGGFHYKDGYYKNFKPTNDAAKDELCKENDIIMIRINCDYIQVDSRFEYIKTNTEHSLNSYFDLSHVDWDKCDVAGNSSLFKQVINYYNHNKKVSLHDIASHFDINIETLYRYLRSAERLGMCTYIRNDQNRINNSQPIAMYTLDGDLIGIYKSTRIIEESFPEKDFRRESIRQNMHMNKPYKGYVFKPASYEEYLAFDEKDYKTNLIGV